jgi:hypothetical protein
MTTDLFSSGLIDAEFVVNKLKGHPDRLGYNIAIQRTSSNEEGVVRDRMMIW